MLRRGSGTSIGRSLDVACSQASRNRPVGSRSIGDIVVATTRTSVFRFIASDCSLTPACESATLHRQFCIQHPGGFMIVAQFGNSRSALMFATMLAVLVLPTASRAYTFEQQQACGGDAFRLCSSEIPDIGRITACMIRNRSQLSPGCRALFRSGEETGSIAVESAGERLSIRHKPRLHRLRRTARSDAT